MKKMTELEAINWLENQHRYSLHPLPDWNWVLRDDFSELPGYAHIGMTICDVVTSARIAEINAKRIELETKIMTMG